MSKFEVRIKASTGYINILTIAAESPEEAKEIGTKYGKVLETNRIWEKGE